MAGEGKKQGWPGLVDQTFPEVFTTIPENIQPKKPGQLQPEQVKQFFEKGYVALEDFFTDRELEAVKGALNTLVDNLAHKLFNAGKIDNLYTEYGLYQRLTMLENDFPGANIVLHKTGKLPQAFRDVLSNERLLNVMEQLLGTEEIMGHPVWNLRTKTPKNEATTVPWHQDNGYFSSDAYGTLVPTAWIPLIDANETNGCLQMMESGHKTGKVAEHQCCHGGTWYVMLSEEEMEKALGIDCKKDCVTIPVPYKGCLLFSNMIPHRSLNNCSDKIRWSLDLRWCEAGKPVGLWGMKDGVHLRSKDPQHKINWDAFDAVDRQKAAFEHVGQVWSEFDTTVPGPWMESWEVVHVNRHTEAHLKELQAGESSVPTIVG